MSDVDRIKQLGAMINELQNRVTKLEELLGGDSSGFEGSLDEIVYKALLDGSRRGMELPRHDHRR